MKPLEIRISDRRFLILTFLTAFPLALVCWWMYAVLLPPTFLGDLGYWQWYAVLVLVRVAAFLFFEQG